MRKKPFEFYKNRQERAQFITKRFSTYIKKSKAILDVGCWKNDFKKIIGSKVTGIDIAGSPDIKHNLENKLVMIKDENFDLIICTDVLEHINNLHQLFDELIRISSKYIILSLPNNLCLTNRIKLLKGQSPKFYSLPFNTPFDRHRWFFSYNEAKNFIHQKSKEKGLIIAEEFPHYNFSNSIKGRFIKLLIKSHIIKNPNLFAQSYWVVLKK